MRNNHGVKPSIPKNKDPCVTSNSSHRDGYGEKKRGAYLIHTPKHSGNAVKLLYFTQSLTLGIMEQATLRKTIVNIAPRWAEEDSYPWHDILEDGDSSAVNSISTSESEVTILPLTNSLPRSPTSIIYKARLIRPTWSEFAIKCQDSCSLFKCICNCHRHGPLDRRRLSVSSLSVRSKKQYLKQFAGLSRGYPTGQCVSSLEPPPWNPWNDMDTGDLLIREHRSSIRTNTAINLESFKMFLNSLLFTTIIKCLTVVILALLAAITYDAITILHRSLNQEAYPTSNAIITLTFTLALSILTIVYFCYTIILESKRPPEGMHTSYSKPLIVIFSEIITSIVWAQVL
ncbi:hypothetical protein BGZ49_007358 [Haplosporangium sp. Z 27]|nr:hypothetical protein BGZ49_007358 [Haplosporangium sp. Z 27]